MLSPGLPRPSIVSGTPGKCWLPCGQHASSSCKVLGCRLVAMPGFGNTCCRRTACMPPGGDRRGIACAAGGKRGGSNSGSGSPFKPSGSSPSSSGRTGGEPARGSGGRGFGGGAGGTRRGGGKAGGRGKAGGKGGAAVAREPPAEGYVSGPIGVELQDELTATELTEEPRWDMWANHMGGEWVGHYSAYTPWGAAPEPVWADAKGRYLDVVYTRCVEVAGEGQEGGGGGGGPLLIRRLARAVTPDQLRGLAVSASPRLTETDEEEEEEEEEAAGNGDGEFGSSSGSSSGGGSSTTGSSEPAAAAAGARTTMGAPPRPAAKSGSGSSSEVDVEGLAFNRDGCVVFTGGAYSAGPDYIGPPQFKILAEQSEDEEEGEGEAGGEEEEGGEEGAAVAEAPTTTTSIIESCLVDWGSKSRVRLKLTVRIGHDAGRGGEVEVEVLRVVLFREYWAGPVGLASGVDDTVARHLLPRDGARAASGGGGAGRLPRASPHGSWSVFTTSATAVEEEGEAGCDAGGSGEGEGREGRVAWVYTTNEDRQLWHVPRGAPTEEDGGGVLWLPHGALATFRMVSYGAGGTQVAAAASSGSAESESGDEGAGAGDSAGGEEAGDSGRGGGATGGGVPQPRGFTVGLMWALPGQGGNQVALVERDYDGAGVLRGVRHSTAVKGGWSGGSM